MPTSEAKPTAQEPREPAETQPKRASTGPLNLAFPNDDRPFGGEVSASEDGLKADEGGEKARIGRGAATSRWVDYDTHELLQMISELEDERRWARLREGIWLALLIHILLLSAITWVPRYIFKVPPVIDPFDAIKQRKDLTYLDLPPDVIKKFQPKVQVKPTPEKQPRVDKKTLEALNKPAPAPPPPEPQPTTPPSQPALTSPVPKVEPSPQPSEAPRPQAVPARPNFAMGSANPADQLRDAMRGARSGPGATQMPGGGQMPMHPGAGGGVQVLSDTQGVDFSSWLLRWHRETERTWDPLIPDEVNPPILKKGAVVIRFRILPNGRLVEPNGMFLEGRSGDTALDRAAWGALTGSNYPPLPKEFHGPYLELRAIFLYNTEPGH
jgi:outer membrane biosynthesis protein TonB